MSKLTPVCDKCGSINITLKYSNGQPTQEQIDLIGLPPEDFSPEESMSFTCERCTYKWTENLNKTK